MSAVTIEGIANRRFMNQSSSCPRRREDLRHRDDVKTQGASPQMLPPAAGEDNTGPRALGLRTRPDGAIVSHAEGDHDGGYEWEPGRPGRRRPGHGEPGDLRERGHLPA